MSETPEEAIAVMRQASEVVSDVLPSALAELVGDHLLDNIDAVLHGSTPQMQWVAREVLALAEQQQTRPAGFREWLATHPDPERDKRVTEFFADCDKEES